MIQIISGQKGKGKTKILLDKANQTITEARGSVVFLDKSVEHMYELNNKIRLINVFDFPIHSYEAFLGFVCGIISQDSDIEEVYLDSFLTLAHLTGPEIGHAVDELNQLGEQFHVNFVLCVSEDNANLPANAQAASIAAL